MSITKERMIAIIGAADMALQANAKIARYIVDLQNGELNDIVTALQDKGIGSSPFIEDMVRMHKLFDSILEEARRSLPVKAAMALASEKTRFKLQKSRAEQAMIDEATNRFESMA